MICKMVEGLRATVILSGLKMRAIHDYGKDDSMYIFPGFITNVN